MVSATIGIVVVGSTVLGTVVGTNVVLGFIVISIAVGVGVVNMVGEEVGDVVEGADVVGTIVGISETSTIVGSDVAGIKVGNTDGSTVGDIDESVDVGFAELLGKREGDKVSWPNGVGMIEGNTVKSNGVGSAELDGLKEESTVEGRAVVSDGEFVAEGLSVTVGFVVVLVSVGATVSSVVGDTLVDGSNVSVGVGPADVEGDGDVVVGFALPVGPAVIVGPGDA